MKRIKLGLLMGAVLMSSVAMAADPKEILLSTAETYLKMLAPLETVENVEPLQDYDYDKNVPPSFDVLTTKVGKKDELEVFLPKKSVQYLNYFQTNQPDAKAFRDKHYRGFGNGKNSWVRIPNPKEGLIDPSTINKMTFYKNGILVNINVAQSPYTKFKIEDLTSAYAVEYEYGKGEVLKADLITTIKIIDEADKNKLTYVLGEYTKSLKNKGYSSQSIFGLFDKVPTYEKDDSVVEVTSDKMSDYASALFGYQYYNATMSFYSQDTHKNYAQKRKDFQEQEYQQEYKKLDRILNK